MCYCPEQTNNDTSILPVTVIFNFMTSYYWTLPENTTLLFFHWEPSRSWSYGSWIYYYLCNQRLSLLKLWVWNSFRRGVLNTTLCENVFQWLAPGRWFSLVSSTNKTDHYDITKILLKVALNTITLTLTSVRSR